MNTPPDSPKPQMNRPPKAPAVKTTDVPAKALPPTPAPKSRRIWEMLGGTSLSISMIFHLCLVVAGLFFVFETIKEPEKKVDFMPPAGGGGSPSTQAITQKHQVRMTQPNLARVAAMGVTSNFTLPEPDELSPMANLGGLSAGGLSGGLGGPGSGGGRATVTDLEWAADLPEESVAEMDSKTHSAWLTAKVLSRGHSTI